MKRFTGIFLVMLLMMPFAAESRKLHILLTNDMHGHIQKKGATFINPENPPMLGGAASAAVYIDKVRAYTAEKGEDLLLLDAGDIFQGAPAGTNSDGKYIIKYFNKIGYDAWTVGNHDFDHGIKKLTDLIQMSTMPVLGANVISKQTNKMLDGLEDYIIIEKNGIRYGIIGVCTAETYVMSSQNVKDSVHFEPPVHVLRELVPKVREKSDVIIVLGHTGLPYNLREGWEEIQERGIQEENEYINTMEILQSVKGIDIYLGGHSHKGEREPWVDPNSHTITFQTYGLGSGMGHLIINIDDKLNAVTGYELPGDNSDLLTLFMDEFGTNPEYEVFIDSMVAIAEAGMDDIIGFSERTIPRGDAAKGLMGHIVADAMREAVDADFAFTNLGGIRDIIRSGNISKRDVFKVLPFNNELIEIWVTGKEFLEILETRVASMRQGLFVSGIEYKFNRQRPEYERTTHLLIDGEPLDLDKEYKVVTTDFLADGNARLYLLSDIPESKKYSRGVTMRDALIQYIKKHSPMDPELDGRWEQDDNSQPDEHLQSIFDKIDLKS